MGLYSITLFFKRRFYLFIFKQKGKEGEREGEESICGCSHVPLTGDLAHHPGMCPDWELNWRPLGSQAGAQFTEPHLPGLYYFKWEKRFPSACKNPSQFPKFHNQSS